MQIHLEEASLQLAIERVAFAVELEKKLCALLDGVHLLEAIDNLQLEAAACATMATSPRPSDLRQIDERVAVGAFG